MITLATNQRRPINPLRLDPTRTTGLRRAFMAEMKQRFLKLRQATYQLIVEEDAFGLKPKVNPFAPLKFKAKTLSMLAANTRWAFETDPKKVKAFQAWFRDQVDRGLLEIEAGVDPAVPWTSKYTTSAYKRGVIRSYIDSKKQALDTGAEFYEGTQAQFLESAFGGPIGTAKIEMLATRSFEQLKGISAQMSQEMNRVLSDGFAQGKGARVIAKDLTDSINGIERRRAMVIARTETINAYAEGQLDSFEALGVEEVGIMSEYSTAGDDLVCPLCLPLEGTVWKIKEARGMIPRHPNCRCSFIPALTEGEAKRIAARELKEEQAKLREASKTRELTAVEKERLKLPKTSKEALERSISKSVRTERPKRSKAEAFERTRWRGADKTIAKVRTPGKSIPKPTAPPSVVPKPTPSAIDSAIREKVPKNTWK